MRNEYVKFLDIHKIRDGVLREMAKLLAKDNEQMINATRDAIARRQKETKALLHLQMHLEAGHRL